MDSTKKMELRCSSNNPISEFNSEMITNNFLIINESFHDAIYINYVSFNTHNITLITHILKLPTYVELTTPLLYLLSIYVKISVHLV